MVGEVYRGGVAADTGARGRQLREGGYGSVIWSDLLGER